MKYLALLGIIFCGLAHAAVSPPQCNPGDYPNNLQITTATDGSIVVLLWCRTNNILTWNGYAWNPQLAPVGTCVKVNASQSLAMAVIGFFSTCFHPSGALNDAQNIALNGLYTKWLPHLVVDSGLASHTVYDYSGCPNELSCRPMTFGNLRIAAGTPCTLPGDIADTQGVPNAYYHVDGEIATNGSVIPSGPYFTPCSVVLPPTNGW